MLAMVSSGSAMFFSFYRQVTSTTPKKTIRQQLVVAVTIASTVGLVWLLGYFLMLSDNITYFTIMNWLFTLAASFQVSDSWEGFLTANSQPVQFKILCVVEMRCARFPFLLLVYSLHQMIFPFIFSGTLSLPSALRAKGRCERCLVANRFQIFALCMSTNFVW